MRTRNLSSKLVAVLLCCASAYASAQSAIIRGEASAGVYENLRSVSQVLQVSAVAPTTGADPCASTTAKSSAVINLTAAATTQLVAISGTTVIYVCGFSMTISQVLTTANTIKFVRGTGASCGTGQADLTGLYGDGGVTAAAPLAIATGYGTTHFKTAAGNALCVTTAIGASASFQGVVTYIQQ